MAASMKSLGRALTDISSISENPEDFLRLQKTRATTCKKTLKCLYDAAKKAEETPHVKSGLPQLVIANFDDEQIWQQLELQNDSAITNLISSVANLISRMAKQSRTVRTVANSVDPDPTASDSDLFEPRAGAAGEDRDDGGPSEADPDDEDAAGEDSDDGASGEEEEEEDQDGQDSEEEEEDIDLFTKADPDDKDLHYADFFDPPEGAARDDDGFSDEEEEEQDLEGEEGDADHSAPTRKTADLFADSDSEGEDVADILGGRKQHKSTFEIRQEKLKKKISTLEEASIAQRPWQMLGETTAGSRPENSLLQENLQFEHTSRLPPEITEETTKSIEDIIRQRIKDKVWDDVERKVRKAENPFEYKKRITLDQEKSKLSLGEIYEQEYLKQQKTEAEEQKDPDHEDVKKMMTSLFLKLDALSNFQYTPKQAAPEVKIVSNQPAITMEEVAPVAFSDTKQLAPEEVKVKPVGEVKGATEKTDTDKLRERKKKKAAKKERQQERDKREKLIEKLKPGLGNKYSKEKALKKLEKESKSGKGQVTLIKSDKKEKNNLTSSSAFFTQLQEEVSTQISSKKMAKRKRGNTDTLKAKKLKL